VNEPGQNMSLCYLYLPDSKNSEEAWGKLLWRAPRTLEWPDINGIASRKRLLGFDFSGKVLQRRQEHENKAQQHRFKILYDKSGISFNLGTTSHFLTSPFSNPLFTHLILKMLLNAHSTLIMGRLGRYEGNVMTYVRASNNKLIDRAVRYIDLLLKKKNIDLSYSDLTHILFSMIEKTPPDHSIVLETVAEIENMKR
jgi:N-acetylmuramic acid 6-phosphate etherase